MFYRLMVFLLMLNKVLLTSKCSIAAVNITCKFRNRFDLRVRLHMLLQIAPGSKWLLAHCATEWLFSCMYPFVTDQITQLYNKFGWIDTYLRECFSTTIQLTNIWLRIIMSPNMFLKGGILSKWCITCCTNIRFNGLIFYTYHLYGFSFVWVLMCSLSVFLLENIFWQSLYSQT